MYKKCGSYRHNIGHYLLNLSLAYHISRLGTMPSLLKTASLVLSLYQFKSDILALVLTVFDGTRYPGFRF